MTFFSLNVCSQRYPMKAKSIVRFFGKTLWAPLLGDQNANTSDYLMFNLMRYACPAIPTV